MSRHTAYRFNLTHKAILATVLGFGTINAQAISLGQPAIQSGQNEPLSATIDVSGIDANQFEASVASNAIYAQMGLTQSADISVQFVRTSDTSGKIILPQTDESDDETPQGTGATYVVQSGDTLWSIARQIAKANNLSIDSVMTALHKQNPDAFDGGKMNRLKTNASLAIPAYEVIPSQQAIQEAILAKRASNTKPTRTTAHTKASASSAKKATRPKTVTKPLPRPQVTLVTPAQSGVATGADSKATAKPASTQPVSVAVGNDDQLLNTLKNTRAQTAQTASRVNGLNQELSTASHKLQLQNQKLAELEARLKALKEKQ